MRTQIECRIRQAGTNKVIWIWLTVSKVPEEKDENESIVGSMTNITEMKLAKQAIQLSENRLEMLSMAAPVGIFKNNLDGHCIFANHQISIITGLRLVDLYENGWMSTVHPEDREKIMTLWGDSLSADTAFEAEFRIKQPNGSVVWVYGKIVPDFDDNSQKTGYIGSLTNIDRRKKAEQENNRLNEMMVKQFHQLKKYAHINSHDLRAPLTNILSIVALLNDLPSSYNQETLDSLTTAAQKLDSVVKELNELVKNADLNTDLNPFAQTYTPKKVCLIDDDQIQHLINKRLIHDINKEIEVVTFLEAEKAFESLTEGKFQPDIILLDINMPNMNGWQFLEKLQSTGYSTEVHMLTSSIDPHDQIKSRDFHLVHGFLSKPLRKEILKSLLMSEVSSSS
jgi:PAS domain S-box-containing protein